jgi:predicted lipid carrier protein YhbT
MPAEPLPDAVRLIAGAIARRAPRPFHAAALDLAMAAMARRHPRLFARLAPFSGAALLIEISDLAITLLLRFGVPPSLRLAEAGDRERAAAGVSGPVTALLALLEGRIDGDALFFSRAIAIRGDTGLVVALRNAVDDAQIDVVADLCAVFGPFSPLARRVAPSAIRGLLRLGRHLDRLQAALFPRIADY